MTSHPNRNAYLAVYIRELSGNLTRHTIKGMDKDAHIEHYNIGPITGADKLTGWPEITVEWHGSTGYGSKAAAVAAATAIKSVAA